MKDGDISNAVVPRFLLPIDVIVGVKKRLFRRSVITVDPDSLAFANARRGYFEGAVDWIVIRNLPSSLGGDAHRERIHRYERAIELAGWALPGTIREFSRVEHFDLALRLGALPWLYFDPLAERRKLFQSRAVHAFNGWSNLKGVLS